MAALAFALAFALSACDGTVNDEDDATYTAIISTGTNSVVHQSTVAFEDDHRRYLYTRLIDSNGRKKTGDTYQWYVNGAPTAGDNDASGRLTVKGPQAISNAPGLMVDSGDLIMVVITCNGKTYLSPVTTIGITR
jgi:hypothetical protein